MFRASGWFHPIRKNVFREFYTYIEIDWIREIRNFAKKFSLIFFLIQTNNNNIFKNMNSDEIKVILFKLGKNRKKNENF